MLKVKVLGSGCANCVNLEKLCREVAEENNIEASIEKITDYKEIMQHGILRTPGLIINDKIIASGKIPVKATLAHWFMNALVEAE